MFSAQSLSVNGFVGIRAGQLDAMAVRIEEAESGRP
jgi:hypothetical protein